MNKRDLVAENNGQIQKENSVSELLRQHAYDTRWIAELLIENAKLKKLMEILPADNVEGATLEWYAAKFELKLGHAHFGNRLRNYAVAVRQMNHAAAPSPVSGSEEGE
jgi:hypothetical protein